MYYLPDDFVGDRVNPPKPISSELLESVQVFNEPEITIGPIPHPDNDRCPDNCDSKLMHGLYRDDRDNGVYGEKYRKPLTATVPTDGVNTGWRPGMPAVDALSQECSNCHFKYPRLRDGLCEQCWLNPDFLSMEPMTLERAVVVLNQYWHRGVNDWATDDRFVACITGFRRSVEYKLTEFEVIAIAEKFEREK